MKLTAEEAQAIEARAFEPYKLYEANLEKYKHTLLKVLDQYPFSEEIKKELEYRQRDLGIKAEDVERIEQPLLAPVKAAYEKKLHRYQQEFSTLVHARYPLEQDVRPGLQSLQRSLGLSDDDIVHIEEKVVHQYEANLEQYKHTLLKVLDQYPFSEEIKKELEYRQRDLGIKSEDVERIAQPLLAPVKAAYEKKLHRYQQEFSTLVHARYPLEQDVRPGLQSLQRSLGLSDDDIVHIEEKVVHQYEANLEQYKHTLLKVLDQYPFSEEIKKELEYRQRDLGIKAEDVERIAQPLLAPVKAAYEKKLYRYQQEFSTLVHARYPLEQDVRPGLQSLQRSLGLSDDDIVHIEEKVVHQYEANLEQYKHTLLKVLDQYPFSEEIKKELEYRQRDLGIKSEDVERIAQPLLAPVKAAYENKLHRYQQEFSTLVQARYPLEQDVRPGLQSLQRSLGLSDDDIVHIEEKVVHQREANQLSTPLVSPLDAKADQQPFVPASTDSQPNRSPRLSLLQKPCLLAGGSIAVVFAVVLTFFLLARTPQHPQSKEPRLSEKPSASEGTGSPVPSPMTAPKSNSTGNTKFDKQDSQEAPADSPQSSVAPDSTELPRMVPAPEVSPPGAEALAVPLVPEQARAPEAIHGECVPALQARGFWCRRSNQSPCLRSIDVSATGEVRPTGVLCDSQDAEQVRTLLEQIPGVRKVVMEDVNFLRTWNKNYVPPGCVVRPWNTNLGRTP